MIVEIADFKVAPEAQTTFCAQLQRGVREVLSQAQGYLGHRVLACSETPSRVVLMVDWRSLEDHTVGFRQSAAFAQWRAIISPFFAAPPQVEHFAVDTAHV